MNLRKFAEFVLFGSIFIATCAVALCMQTSVLLDVPFNNASFYCFVFGATLVQYNLHYLVKKSAVKDSHRLAWSLKNKKLHKILTGFGISLILFSFLSFRLHHFVILGVLGIISILYSFPILPIGNKKRIKDYGFMKIVTLSLLWTLVTVWFPVANVSFDGVLFAFIFLERFIFIFVLCLAFDIRDIDIDGSENISTIAVLSGKKKSYIFIYLALIFFIFLSVVQFFYFDNKAMLVAMIISAMITFFIIEITKKVNSDFIYLAGVDGMMLLQPALVFLLSLNL